MLVLAEEPTRNIHAWDYMAVSTATRIFAEGRTVSTCLLDIIVTRGIPMMAAKLPSVHALNSQHSNQSLFPGPWFSRNIQKVSSAGGHRLVFNTKSEVTNPRGALPWGWLVSSAVRGDFNKHTFPTPMPS